jgi:hypothetical protein
MARSSKLGCEAQETQSSISFLFVIIIWVLGSLFLAVHRLTTSSEAYVRPQDLKKLYPWSSFSLEEVVLIDTNGNKNI